MWSEINHWFLICSLKAHFSPPGIQAEVSSKAVADGQESFPPHFLGAGAGGNLCPAGLEVRNTPFQLLHAGPSLPESFPDAGKPG